jgi:hypothetical protein
LQIVADSAPAGTKGSGGHRKSLQIVADFTDPGSGPGQTLRA